jgi:hypothetical protein
VEKGGLLDALEWMGQGIGEGIHWLDRMLRCATMEGFMLMARGLEHAEAEAGCDAGRETYSFSHRKE